jgi:hypothetical protein
MKILCLIFILLIFYSSVFGAVSELDGWIEGLSARTVSAGSNRLILFHSVSEGENGAITLDSVKYGSVKLTRAAQADIGSGSNFRAISMFLLKEVDIPGGSNSFTVFWTNESAQNAYASAVYAGVDQTTPISDTVGLTNSDETFGPEESITLDVTTGSYTTVSVLGSSTGRTFTWANATEEFEYTITAASAALATNSEGSDGTNQITVTLSSSSTRGLMLGCTVAPAAAAGGDVSYVRRIKEGEGK